MIYGHNSSNFCTYIYITVNVIMHYGDTGVFLCPLVSGPCFVCVNEPRSTRQDQQFLQCDGKAGGGQLSTGQTTTTCWIQTVFHSWAQNITDLACEVARELTCYCNFDGRHQSCRKCEQHLNVCGESGTVGRLCCGGCPLTITTSSLHSHHFIIFVLGYFSTSSSPHQLYWELKQACLHGYRPVLLLFFSSGNEGDPERHGNSSLRRQ